MDKNRIGRFTSSELHRLSTPAKAKEYAAEKRYERKLKRSLKSETFSYEMSWGSLMELYVNETYLPVSWKMEHKTTIVHPTIDTFAGSPDIIATELVGEEKNPFTLKSFCKVVENCTLGYEIFKQEHDNYFKQLIGNSILTYKKRIALIVFCPTLEELPKIAEFIENMEGIDEFEYKWIYDEITYKDPLKMKIPYLLPESDYKNLNIFEFDVNDADQKELLERIEKYSPLITL